MANLQLIPAKADQVQGPRQPYLKPKTKPKFDLKPKTKPKFDLKPKQPKISRGDRA